MRGALLVLLACIALGGCAGRVAPIPPLARSQGGLAPPPDGWFAQGRFLLTSPGRQLSCTALVRALGDGRVRMVLLSDEGLQLIDLTAGRSGTATTTCLAGLSSIAPTLGWLVLEAYGPGVQATLHQDGGRLVARLGAYRRIYSGDPVALRAVLGRSVDLEIGDYLVFDHTLLALAVRGRFPLDLATIELRLDPASVRLLAAPGPAPASSPTPPPALEP